MAYPKVFWNSNLVLQLRILAASISKGTLGKAAEATCLKAGSAISSSYTSGSSRRDKGGFRQIRRT